MIFRFLIEAARPEKDYLCWYEPAIGKSGIEANFILFEKRLGLVILEVKDWTCRQITSCNPQNITKVSGLNNQHTLLSSSSPEEKEVREEGRSFNPDEFVIALIR